MSIPDNVVQEACIALCMELDEDPMRLETTENGWQAYRWQRYRDQVRTHLAFWRVMVKNGLM